jgi:hypothetical protein
MIAARAWHRYESFRGTLPLLLLAYAPSFLAILFVAQEVYRDLSRSGLLFWLSLFPMFSYSLPGFCFLTWIARSIAPARVPLRLVRWVIAVSTVMLLPHYVACSVFTLWNGLYTDGLMG